jgi:hypothetical protein
MFASTARSVAASAKAADPQMNTVRSACANGAMSVAVMRPGGRVAVSGAVRV